MQGQVVRARRAAVALAVLVMASVLATATPAHAATNVSGSLLKPDGSAWDGGSGAGVAIMSDEVYLLVEASPTTGAWSAELEPGDYQVNGSAPGRTQYAASQTVNLTVTSTGFALAANPRLQTATVSGVVSMPGSDTPAGSGFVELRSASGMYLGGADLFAGANGVFTFALPNGSYKLQAYPEPDGATVESAEVPVTSPQTGITLALRTGNILGQVLPPGTSTAAVPWAEVDATDVDTSEQVGWAAANENGHFALQLADGTYDVRVRPPHEDINFWAMSTLRVVVAGQVTTIDGQPAGSGRFAARLRESNVRGRVTGPNGEAIDSGGWVEVLQQDQFGDWDQVSGESTTETGAFGFALADGTYQLRAEEPWQNPNRWSAGTRTITVSGGVVTAPTGSLTVALQAPNVLGTVLTPSGDPVASTSVEVRTADGDWTTSTWGHTGDDGTFAVRVDDGSYLLVAHPLWDDETGLTYGTREITVSGGVVTAPSGALTVSLREPNVRGYIVRPGSPRTVVPNVSVDVFDTASRQFVDGASDHTGQDGGFSSHLPDGAYRITAEPWRDVADVVASSVDVTVAGGVLTEVAGGPASIPFDLALRTPNVLGTVKTPDGSAVVADGSINIRVAYGGDHVGWAYVDEQGRWATYLVDGSYEATIRPPWDNAEGYVQRTVTFTVAGGDIAVTSGATLTDGRIVTNLLSSNVSGTVRSPDGSQTVSGAWVNVVNSITGHWVDAWATSGQNGAFSLRLEDGSYTVTAQPPWTNPSGWTAASAAVLVDGGDVTMVDGAAASTVSIRVGTPNVTGSVTAGGQGVQGTWVDVRNADTGEWRPGTHTRTGGGVYSLTLPNGRWELTGNPSWQDPGEFVRTSITVTVDGATVTPSPADIALTGANVTGQVRGDGDGLNDVGIDVRDADTGQWVEGSWTWTRESGTTDGTFGIRLADGSYVLTSRPNGMRAGNFGVQLTSITVAGGAVTAVTAGGTLSDGSVHIDLPGANVGGTVYRPDGTTPVPNAPVQARSSDGRWIDNAWTQTRADGSYSLTLPEGIYEITATPPWWTNDGAKATITNVVVPAGGAITGQNISLTTPNVTGTVLPPGTSTTGVPNASIEVFDTGNGRYVDAGVNTKADGSFALLLSDGTYQLTVRPPWQNTSGWAQTEVAITVAGGSQTGGAATIRLNEPTVSGTVSASGIAAIGDVWINVERQTAGAGTPGDATDDAWEWYGWTSSRSNGRYGFYVEGGHFGSAFRITAHPPWSSTAGWVRKTVTQTVTGTTTVDIAFANGNVSGSVLAPTGTTAIPDSWISVQRRAAGGDTPGDASDDTWEWFGSWAHSSRDGSFSLNIDGAAQAETYRLTAHPGWYNPNRWLAGSRLVTVTADGTATWATVDGDADDVIRLSIGNISGTVSRANGSTRVSGAMLDIREDAPLVVNAEDEASVQASATTDSQGRFGLTLPNGTYWVRAIAPPGSNIANGAFRQLVVDDSDGNETWTFTLAS